MYFFKQHKLNRLYNKQDKLNIKLHTCTNKAKKTVLEAKLSDVDRKITKLEIDIKYRRK